MVTELSWAELVVVKDEPTHIYLASSAAVNDVYHNHQHCNYNYVLPATISFAVDDGGINSDISIRTNHHSIDDNNIDIADKVE